MTLNAPYKQQVFMGIHANDAAALAFIQAMHWDSTKDGLGNPEEAMTYWDTTLTVQKVYDGAAWQIFAAGAGVPNLTQVLGAGNSAGASTINMNANKITGVAAGTVAGDALCWGQFGAELNGLDVSGQRVTNMAAPSASTDAATKGYVDQVVQGLAWQDEVIDRNIDIPPGAPVLGDRYIIGAFPIGAWIGHAQDITEWDGAAWIFTPERQGLATWVLSENTAYVWNGAAWVKLSALVLYTLDMVYDAGGAGLGRSITADAGDVNITVPDGSNNVVLKLTQNDVTNNPSALQIVNAGSGASIALEGTTRLIKSDANLTLQVDSKAYLCTGAGGQVSLGNSGRALVVAGDTISIEGSAAGGNVVLRLNANVAALRDLQIDAENANALGARITLSDSWQKDSGGAGGYTVAMPFASSAAEWTNFKNDWGDGVSLLSAIHSSKDHGLLTGLADDDHTQYALLAGRAGGQTLIGGTAATDDLILRATAGVGASGSDIIFQVGNNGATEAGRILYDGLWNLKGSIKFGLDAAAPGADYTIVGHGSTGGSNAGGDVTIRGGAGTGIAANGDLILQGGITASPASVTTGGNVLVEGGKPSASAVGGYVSISTWEGAGPTKYERFRFAPDGNFGSITAWGTNAVKVFGLASGTAPTAAHPTDAIQMWCADRGGTVAKAGLHLRSEDGTSHVLSDLVGLGTVLPTAYVDMEFAGTVTADKIFLEITNTANAAAMTDTRTSILFNQWYYDAVTPAVADAAEITVGTEGNWTSAGANQNAYMAFQTALGGTVAERWRIASTGALSNTGAIGTAYLHLKAGTATANTGPLKFTTGTLLATPEVGVAEFLTPTLYFTAVQRLAVPGTMYAMVTSKTVANEDRETALYDDTSTFGTRTIAAGNLNLVGKTVRIAAKGFYGTKASGPGRLNLRVRFGGVAGTLILSTGERDLTAALGDVGWEVNALVTVTVVADAGTVNAQGLSQMAVSTTAADHWFMVNTSGVAVDTNNTAQEVSLTAQFSLADAGNTITCTDFVIELLN